jgi:predicted ATPase
VAWHFAAMVFQLCRNHVRARTCAEMSGAISAEHGFAFWLAGGSVLRGWALAAGGETGTGTERLKQGLEAWQATGSLTYQTYFLGLLADALARQSASEQSGNVLNEALELVTKTDERLYEAELYRLRGELVEQRSAAGDDAQAEADFRKALRIARQQGAKSLELRAAASLLRLHLRQNRPPGEAAESLRGAYAAFREGFQTPDLQDARGLLERV